MNPMFWLSVAGLFCLIMWVVRGINTNSSRFGWVGLGVYSTRYNLYG